MVASRIGQADIISVEEPPEFSSLLSDEERIKCVLQCIAKNHRVARLVYYFKGEEKARIFLNRAADIFKNRQNPIKALPLYNLALVHVRTHTSLQCQIYLRRARALLELGLYLESLRDIERVKKIGYAPSELKSLLYLYEAQALLMLDKTLRPEVEKAIEEIQKWLYVLTPADQRKIKKELCKVQSGKLPAKKSFSTWDFSRFLPPIPQLKDNSSDDHLDCSSLPPLPYSFINYGKYALATKDVQAGEALVVHKNYASIPHNFKYDSETRIVIENGYDFCWQCTLHIVDGIACPKCINVIYCNEKCRDEAWREHHDLECLIITNMIAARIISNRHLMSLRLTIRAIKEMGSLFELKNHARRLANMNDFKNSSGLNKYIDTPNYMTVASLKSYPNTRPILFQDAVDCARMLAFFVRCTEPLQREHQTFPDLVNYEWVIFLGVLFLNNLKIHDMNGVQIISRRKSAARVSAIMPFLSFFHHNCDPNTTTYTSGNITSLIAVQLIKQGDQITVCGGKHFRDRETATDEKPIDCSCMACAENWYADTRFPFCMSLLAVDTKLQLRDLLREGLKKRTCEVSDADKVYEYIEYLKKMLNLFGLYAADCYPCEEIVDFKRELIMVYRRIHL